RVPLLLADLPDRDRDAQSRLGAGEHDRPLLRDRAVMWRPGIDPRAVVAQAATLVQDDEAYAAFLHRYRSNPGSAGAGCAGGIRGCGMRGRDPTAPVGGSAGPQPTRARRVPRAPADRPGAWAGVRGSTARAFAHTHRARSRPRPPPLDVHDRPCRTATTRIMA